jgi:hypothetical protein
MNRSSYAPIIAAIVTSAAYAAACGGSTEGAAGERQADAAPVDASLVDGGPSDAAVLRDAALRPGFASLDCTKDGAHLSALTAKPPLDYVELREEDGYGGSDDVMIEKSGTLCANAADAAACKRTFAAIQRPVKLSCSVPYPCTARYLAYTRGDEVAYVLPDAVTELAAPIDSLDEAIFTLSLSRSFECEGSSYRKTDDGYDFAYTYSVDDCPSSTGSHRHDVLVHEAADGVITVVEDVDTFVPSDVPNAGCPVARGASDLVFDRIEAITDAGDWLATAARLEAASVGSFVRLARELAAHGAPATLVRRAARAARDERRHAASLRAPARAAGKRVMPAPRVARVIRSLESIAAENASDGAARETWAAVVVSYQARAARSESVRQAFASIAIDETSHAELASDVGDWLARRLGAGAAHADAKRRRTIAAIEREILRAHPAHVRAPLGLPSPEVARRLFAGARAPVRRVIARDGEAAASVSPS